MLCTCRYLHLLSYYSGLRKEVVWIAGKVLPCSILSKGNSGTLANTLLVEFGTPGSWLYFPLLEVCVLVILALSGLYDCVFFSRAMLSQPRLQLTPAQKKLLNVNNGPGEFHNLAVDLHWLKDES